jgi:hypothetical protein
MIAPNTNFDLNVIQPTKAPAIVKKPVSFFNAPQQEQQPTQQPAKQQPTQPLQVENTTTELEEMHIGLNEFMEGAPKAKKKSEKQLLHLAKMRQQKALKREQTKSTQAQTPLPSAPQQSTIQQNQQHQPYENLNDIIAKEFKKLYSAKESIRQREKAIRQETKQKVLSKLMAQQKLTAQAPVPTPAPAPTPAPQPIESKCNRKYQEANKKVIREQRKEYRKRNKDVIKERNNQYYEANKKQIIEQVKQYNQTNKEHIIEQKKEYYKENKEKLNQRKKETIKCECGCEVIRNHIARHKKSNKHKDLMDEQ